MTVNWNKPIETMTGLPAKVISNDYRSCDGKIRKVLQVENKTSSFTLIVDEEGFPSLIGSQCIRNVKVKHEAWQNIHRDYSDQYYIYDGALYKSEKLARNASSHLASYITTIKIQWEE